MATELKLRGGTTAEHATFTGAAREATVDTDKNTIVVHDGSTAGGFPLAREEAGQGVFAKADPYSVAWERPTGDTVRTAQQLYIEVGGRVFDIPAQTTVTVPTFAVGTDYAIWAKPDGSLEATSSFTSPPVAGSRWVGGFHYAPGGKATGTSGGDTVAQIMDTSFYDLKWRPSVVDPRGCVLVGNGSFWTGMYHMSANHLTGPVHKYNVDPCRDGNPPQNITAAGNYPNASPANIIEALQFHGFRAPDFWEFQLLAYGTTEATSLGGSGPGLTGVLSSGAGNKQRFTSQWGVFDATGVLWHWGNDTILTTSNQTLPNPARGGIFRYSHFALFGGVWNSGANSGSRLVLPDPAANSGTFGGSRGVCDHLILV